MTSSFRALHERLRQCHCVHGMVESDIALKQNELDRRIRNWISDLRYFCYLDIWYPFLSMSNVSEFVRSSGFMREAHKVYQGLRDVPVKVCAQKAEEFLGNIQKYIRVVCKCADYYFDNVLAHEETKCRCVPGRAVSFFAASTFPGMFGYCWCKEQGLMYVEGICMLLVLQTAKSQVMSVEFRTKSYLRDVIRHFFHMQGIQKYLQKALGAKMTDMMHDSKFLRLDKAQNASKKYIDMLYDYGLKFKQGLVESLGHFPPLLKYFFRRAFEIGKMSLVKLLFMDFVLSPAIANPQLFGIVSETTYVVQTQRIISDLNSMMTWAVSPDSIREGDSRVLEFKDLIEDPKFQELSVQKVLDKLSGSSEKVGGTSLLQLNAVTSMGYHWMLLSLNDLQFISEIVRSSIDKITGEDQMTRGTVETVTDFGLHLETSEIIDFWFKCEKLPSDTLRGLRGTLFRENFKLQLPIFGSVVKPKDVELTPAISYLVKYLYEVQPSRLAPDTVRGFLQFQKDQGRTSKRTSLVAKTEFVEKKIKHLPEDSLCQTLGELVTKELNQSKYQLAVAFRHQEFVEHVTAESDEASTMNDQLAPIIHQAILHLFLNKRKDIHRDVVARKSELLTASSAWEDLFSSLAKELTTFVTDLGLTNQKDHNRLTRQFHTKLCTDLTIREYRKLHPDMASKDKEILKQYDTALEKFMDDKFSKVLVQLFQAPDCFISVIEGFQGRIRYGSPLEFLERISHCMVGVQEIYFFEAGEGCPGDDFLPLFVYVLLRARLPNLYSLSCYLDAMLLQINDRVKILESKEKYVATTFMSSVNAIIGFCNIQVHP